MYKFFKISFYILTILFFLSSSLYAQSISQYFAPLVKNISNNSIVSVGGNNIVLGVYPTTSPNDNNLVGVVDYKSNITTGISGNVPVVSSGTVNVLVSNINGVIKKGDYITSSIIPGVGEKDTQSGKILGKALSNFSFSHFLYKKTIFQNGKSVQILVEKIPVLLGISYFTYNNNFSGILLSFGKAVVGKNVSFFNSLIAILIISVGVFTLIYGVSVSLKHSLLGISRNPLSKDSIEKNLVFIIISLIFIFMVTLVLGYLILIF